MRKVKNSKNTIFVGINLDSQVPTIANRNEKTIVGIPRLKSRRSFMLV